uniref:Uncharacterized protein n=1 Tax=Parascaris equorum TaxID=6256 RepID=A0A914R8V1_PAREQ
MCGTRGWQQHDFQLSIVPAGLVITPSIAARQTCMSPPLKYLTIYPFTPLTIAKCFTMLMHIYLIVSTIFTSIWAYTHSTDVISNLLIAHWGAATTDDEIETLLLQF